MNKRRGFTLIELLIVVVIVAILAALIVPRFLSQPEIGYIAEAQRTLGMLLRAQAAAIDQGLSIPALTAADTQANMPLLGLNGISNKNFTFTCEAGGASCTALRSGDAANGSVTLVLGGGFSCDEVKYRLVSAEHGCGVKS